MNHDRLRQLIPHLPASFHLIRGEYVGYVAQQVEHSIHNAQVDGSNPSITIRMNEKNKMLRENMVKIPEPRKHMIPTSFKMSERSHDQLRALSTLFGEPRTHIMLRALESFYQQHFKNDTPKKTK